MAREHERKVQREFIGWNNVLRVQRLEDLKDMEYLFISSNVHSWKIGDPLEIIVHRVSNLEGEI